MTAPNPLDEPGWVETAPAIRTGILRIRITGQPDDVKLRR